MTGSCHDAIIAHLSGHAPARSLLFLVRQFFRAAACVQDTASEEGAVSAGIVPFRNRAETKIQSFDSRGKDVILVEDPP